MRKRITDKEKADTLAANLALALLAGLRQTGDAQGRMVSALLAERNEATEEET